MKYLVTLIVLLVVVAAAFVIYSALTESAPKIRQQGCISAASYENGVESGPHVKCWKAEQGQDYEWDFPDD